MPNFGYMLVQFIYLLALTIWIGGTVAIGALTAPNVFRTLSDRASAGEIMGKIFYQFDRVKDICSLVLITTSLAKFLTWERNWNVWIASRHLALSIMIFTALTTGWVVGPTLQQLRSAGPPEARSAEVAARFQKLHRISVLMMQVGLVAALVALLLS